MYALNVTNLDQWHENVTLPATEIIENYITDTPSRHERLPLQAAVSTANSEDDTYSCDVCERVFIGDFQWRVHQKSHRHKKMIARKNKLAMKARQVEEQQLNGDARWVAPSLGICLIFVFFLLARI